MIINHDERLIQLQVGEEYRLYLPVLVGTLCTNCRNKEVRMKVDDGLFSVYILDNDLWTWRNIVMDLKNWKHYLTLYKMYKEKTND